MDRGNVFDELTDKITGYVDLDTTKKLHEVMALCEQLFDAGYAATQVWTPASEKPHRSAIYEVTRLLPNGKRQVTHSYFGTSYFGTQEGWAFSCVIAWRELSPPFVPEEVQL